MLKAAHVRPRYLHLANSAGIFNVPESHFDLVRPGIMLYGYYPVNPWQESQAAPGVLPKARISHIKFAEAGRYIGYEMTYQVPEDTYIATMPIGFADGYPRSLSGKGSVLVNGKKYPLAGRICMDQCMADLKGDPQPKVGTLQL